MGQSAGSPKAIEGYFRRSRQSRARILVLLLILVIGSVLAIYGIANDIPTMTLIVIPLTLVISLWILWRMRKARVKVRFGEGRLSIRGGGYQINLLMPFRYQVGVEHIRRRRVEFAYIRLVIDVYGRPLVFEEHVPAGKQAPALPEIMGEASALGIAELSSLNKFPGTLWRIMQQLESDASQSSRSQIQNDIANLYRIGAEQLQREDYYGAIGTFSEIIRLMPDASHAYYNRGIAHFYRGIDHRKAMNDLTTTIRLKPDFAQAFKMRGLLKAEMGDWAGLRDDISTAIQLTPHDGDLYNTRGSACYRLQDYQAAMRDLNRAIELIPRNAEPYHNRGLVRQRLGDAQGAIADFRYALTINPDFQLSRDALQIAEQAKRG